MVVLAAGGEEVTWWWMQWCCWRRAEAAMVVWQRGIEEVARWWRMVASTFGGGDGFEGDEVGRCGCGLTAAVVAGIWPE
nr:hypothetical protein [Tanacetum cinerariifolium]